MLLQRTTTLETSALEILYSGQVTLSTQLMKPDNLFLTVSGFFLIAFLNVNGLSFMNSNQLRAVKSLLLNFTRISKLKHFHIFQKYVNKINYLSLILLFNYLNPDNHTTFHTPCSWNFMQYKMVNIKKNLSPLGILSIIHRKILIRYKSLLSVKPWAW